MEHITIPPSDNNAIAPFSARIHRKNGTLTQKSNVGVKKFTKITIMSPTRVGSEKVLHLVSSSARGILIYKSWRSSCVEEEKEKKGRRGKPLCCGSNRHTKPTTAGSGGILWNLCDQTMPLTLIVLSFFWVGRGGVFRGVLNLGHRTIIVW